MTWKCGEHEWIWSEEGLSTIRDAEFNEAQAHQAKFTSHCKTTLLVPIALKVCTWWFFSKAGICISVSLYKPHQSKPLLIQMCIKQSNFAAKSLFDVSIQMACCICAIMFGICQLQYPKMASKSTSWGGDYFLAKQHQTTRSLPIFRRDDLLPVTKQTE